MGEQNFDNPSPKNSDERTTQPEHEQKGPSTSPSSPDNPGAQKSSAFLKILLNQAKDARLKENWQADPKTVIDQMLDDIPDDVTTYTVDTQDRAPMDEPKPLELYLLSHIRNLPEFLDTKPEGALSVYESVACLRDEIRTKKFLLGIRDAIAELDAVGTDEIRMCDAGSGAIPILAIYAALCSDKVHCEALELNPNAALIAQEVVREFGLEDRIHIRQTDATTFQPEKPLDFLVSETMASGLTAEPIVQILSNLQPHVKDGGITFPSRINVLAALIPFEDYVSRDTERVSYGKEMEAVIKQGWGEVVNYRPGDDLDEIAFTLPTADKPKGNYIAGITTAVDIGSQHLAPYQSNITMPQYIRKDNGAFRLFTLTGDPSQEPINVQYKPGEKLLKLQVSSAK